MITMRQKSNFRRLKSYLTVTYPETSKAAMEHTGVEGRAALKAATPVDTGLTRDSWHFKTVKVKDGYRLSWYNTNLTTDQVPLVVLLEYGHGTRNGGYVPAKRFIRNAMAPIKAEFYKKLSPQTETSTVTETAEVSNSE